MQNKLTTSPPNFQPSQEVFLPTENKQPIDYSRFRPRVSRADALREIENSIGYASLWRFDLPDDEAIDRIISYTKNLR